MINRFGRLEHMKFLSFHECYVHGNFAFFLVADLPLTLARVVAYPATFPTEKELGSSIYQVCT